MLATIKRMAGGGLINAPPEGIELLRSDKDGRIYVINEVLSYYQRKLNVLGIDDAKRLAHHIFEPNKVNDARKVLHSLWVSSGLEPIPQHAGVINNIIARRQLRNSSYRLVLDILDFLQIEDCRLKVTFLTLECEKIPSKVTEQEAVKDVLVLLEKNEYNYEKVLKSFEDKQRVFDEQASLLQTVKSEMYWGFKSYNCVQ